MINSQAPAVEPAAGSITLRIGGVDVAFHTSNPEFLKVLTDRYNGFIVADADPPRGNRFDIDLTPRDECVSADSELTVRRDGDLWHIERGDFHSTWDPITRRGRIRQSANPYSIDSVLRILHTLVLAETGGFLLHAASAIRDGRAFLFAGVSGVGKTTITRLAPRDLTILTDEISYVRKEACGYSACGTPFAGELARVGANVQAPLAGLFLLKQGTEHRIDDVPAEEAVREVLRNVLFFAEDVALVHRVFRAACDLVEQVPVRRLTFLRDPGVWELVK